MPRYVLMFVGDDERWARQGKDETQRAYAEIGKWWEDLSRKGVIKGGEELMAQETATTVRRVNGQMKVFDGPFVETKESVGGFALIEVPDLDQAIAIAKTWPGNSATVEVRPTVEH
jgi:hypothetical protein